MPTNGKLNILLVTVIFILASVQVFLLNRYSTMGDSWNNIDAETTKTARENDILNQKIASASAISSLSARAEKLGLVNGSKIISLTKNLPLAYSLDNSL